MTVVYEMVHASTMSSWPT